MSTGVYATTYLRSLEDPQAFWSEAAQDIDWITPPDRVLDDSRPPFYRWFPGATLNTCFNALDRHVDRRSRRAGGDPLRLAGHRARSARITYAELLDGRAPARRRAASALGRRARATASSSTCRWSLRRSSPCWPARGSARSTRWCSAGSPRPSWRPASTTPGRRSSSPRRAGSSRVASSSTSPSSTRPSSARRHQPERLRGPPARAGPGRAQGERDVDWADFVSLTGRRRGGRLRRGRRDRPALHPLHLRHDREAEGRRARQRRPRGRAALVDGERLRRPPGRDVVHGQRRRLGRRPLLHRLRAAAHRLHDGPLRGQAGGHARRRGVLAGDLRVRRRRDVHRADRIPGHQEGGRRRREGRRVRPLLAAHPVPRRGAARPRHVAVGDRPARDPGRRQLVADRDRLADRRQPARARDAPDQAGLAVGAGARV